MNIGTLTASLGVNTAGLNRANVAMQNLQKTTLTAVNAMNASLQTVGATAASSIQSALAYNSRQMVQTITAANRYNELHRKQVADNNKQVLADTTKTVDAMTGVVMSGSTRMLHTFESLNKGIGRVGQGLRSFGWLATTVFTAPILMAGKSAIKAQSDFEYAMMKIVGLVGISREQVKAWSSDIMTMSKEIGKTPQELADALYFVTSSGFKTAAALDIVKASAIASAAGLGEAKDIADLVTSVMNSYGQGNISATRTLDILTEIGRAHV